MNELNELLKSIKNKDFLPVYFLHGTEAYFIDVVTRALEEDALSEEEKAFDQTVIYGKDTSYEEIFSLARQFPMMGGKQLIIVKEAQDLKITEKNADILTAYFENPVESTILVFAHKYKKLDVRRKFGQILKKKKWIFESKPLYDNQVPAWISQQITAMGFKAETRIPALLAQYLGTDLSRIDNELRKLKLILKPGQVLNGALVEQHIGISKDYNVFALQKAIGEKSADAMKIAFFMGKNMKDNPMVLVVGALFNYFSKILLVHTAVDQSKNALASTLGTNPFFVEEYKKAAQKFSMKETTRAISLLREIDMKSKGLGSQNVPEDQLLAELVYKLMNVSRIKVRL